MSLQKKILDLRLHAALAERIAFTWQKAIDTHGEDKATQFYTHLGLNHLPKKSFDYDGLTLSREPKEHEKLAVKGIAQAQESNKEAIGSILLGLRQQLISDGLEGIAKLSPANYHELTLQASSEFRTGLRDRLIEVHLRGRQLVATEMARNRTPTPEQASRFLHLFSMEVKQQEDDFDDLDTLTDLTNSRVTNDVQSRLIAAASRYRLLGLTAGALINAVTNEITTGSVSYIDRAATGLANKVINIGRSDEAQSRSDQWGRVEYSALLDANVCGPCAEDDGQEAANEADLTPTPNPECEGGDWCRCFHVFVQD